MSDIQNPPCSAQPPNEHTVSFRQDDTSPTPTPPPSPPSDDKSIHATSQAGPSSSSPSGANIRFFRQHDTSSSPHPPRSPPESKSTALPAWAAAEHASSQIRPVVDPSAPPLVPLSWVDVCDAIANQRVDIFKRNPADRVVYKAWSRKTISQYGSMTAYMCARRLHWTPLPSSTPDTGPMLDAKSAVPFADPADWRILFNDWPYGSLEPEIVHLIVWLKTRIEVNAEGGLPTPASRQRSQAFVDRTFVTRLAQEKQGSEGDGQVSGLTPEEKVVWFKNPPALQTVAGLEHIHVLVRHVPQSILEEWTGESGPQH